MTSELRNLWPETIPTHAWLLTPHALNSEI
jgi:hypothetical protein